MITIVCGHDTFQVVTLLWIGFVLNKNDGLMESWAQVIVDDYINTGSFVQVSFAFTVFDRIKQTILLAHAKHFNNIK